MWLFLVTVLVILVTWLLVTSFRRSGKYPPGPPRLPLLGQTFAMDRIQPHKTLNHWASQYGPVYGVKLGVKELVVLSSPALIREVFNRPEVSARPESDICTLLDGGNFGLLFSNGPLWKENRRFTLRHLRDFGVGKSAIEVSVREEIQKLIDTVFTPNLGQPIDVTDCLFISILSIIWAVITGDKLQHGDKQIIYLMQLMDRYLCLVNTSGAVDYFPWLKYVVPDSVFQLKQVSTSMTDFHRFAKIQFEDHKSTYNSSHMRDYLDCYLRKMKDQEGNENSLFFEWQLMANMLDFFLAGGETTSTTIRWALLFLCHYPHHQNKLQEEIDNVIGRHRQPEFSDKIRMPYMEAFIAEVQRKADILPVGVPHVTDQETVIGGYTIPRGTVITALLYRVHSDPTLWRNPLQFDPTRFLDVDGKFVKNENLMPFSVGRRQCLGEILARVELFLFLTCFLQQFSFRFPKGHSVSEKPRANARFVQEPQSFQLIILSRE